MKRITLLTTLLFLIGAFSMTMPIFADESVEASKFAKVSGVVIDVEEHNDQLRVTLEDENDMQNILLMSDESILLKSNSGENMDKKEIREGMKIEAFFDKSKPHIMIYPPTFTPEVVIAYLEEDPGQVKVGQFDENLVSLDGELKLLISEDTVILNEDGKTITKEQLQHKELVVFYTNSTKSIPAQTTPEKVIALNVVEDEQPDEEMLPIREMAEDLGYKVTWHNKERMVMIQNDSKLIKLTIGEKEYMINSAHKVFDKAPELINGKTFVPSIILEDLK